MNIVEIFPQIHEFKDRFPPRKLMMIKIITPLCGRYMASVASVLFWTSLANATVITSDLDLISSPSIGSGSLGTVTLIQNGPDEVDVSVILSDNTYFVSTGGPHHAFVFNLDLASSYSVTITSPTGGVFALSATDPSNTPYGEFSDGIDCPGCGSGASREYAGPLDFKITDASGVSVDDFVKNAGGYFFSADVIGPNGGSGNIASNVAVDPPDPAPVPEPSSLVLLIAGLFGFGVAARRKRSRTDRLPVARAT